MPHCDLRVRWKVASDLRFRAAISEPKTPSFCGISGDLAQSTRKSLATAMVRFWCAKTHGDSRHLRCQSELTEFFAELAEFWRESSVSCLLRNSPCRKRSPAKGVWQKSDEKSDRSISEKVTTKKWPKESRKRKKWSNSFCRPPFAAPRQTVLSKQCSARFYFWAGDLCQARGDCQHAYISFGSLVFHVISCNALHEEHRQDSIYSGKN